MAASVYIIAQSTYSLAWGNGSRHGGQLVVFRRLRITPAMTNLEMLTLFGLAMFALALAAILIDWISRPNRRRFVPKIYRYPSELDPPPDPTRTAWSDANFVVPDNPPLGEPVHFSDGTTEWSGSAFRVPEAPERPVVLPVPGRSEGWSPGQFVFNLTRSGGEPSPDVVSRRFWKNVSISDHRGAFGLGNETRVAEGKSPVRINPRTGQEEFMKLVGTKFYDKAGQPPQAVWPGEATDPFGSS